VIRPRRINHESTGTLSRARITWPHLGHALGGETIDSPRGTRQITTLRKDPMRRPTTTPQTPTYHVGTSVKMLSTRTR
jgi:hypothetical protein